MGFAHSTTRRLCTAPLSALAGRLRHLSGACLFALSGFATAASPQPPGRIADAWPAHNEVVVMLGAGDRIVATSLSEQSRPWLYRIAPAMKKAATVFHPGGDVQIEALLETRPDIVFMSGNPRAAATLDKLGLNVVQMNFTDFASLKVCFQRTADILGPSAQARAQRYIAYLDATIRRIESKTADIPEAQRPRILHVAAANPLTIDGENTIIDAWIKAAGGRNAARGIAGNQKRVGIEQILAMNPDVIILGNNARGLATELTGNPIWKNIGAVRNRRIHVNPDGAFPWDRYGAEVALQIPWAARQLYPSRFSDIDILQETRRFYLAFFDYPLTNQEAEAILRGQPPLH